MAFVLDDGERVCGAELAEGEVEEVDIGALAAVIAPADTPSEDEQPRKEGEEADV